MNVHLDCIAAMEQVGRECSTLGHDVGPITLDVDGFDAPRANEARRQAREFTRVDAVCLLSHHYFPADAKTFSSSTAKRRCCKVP